MGKWTKLALLLVIFLGVIPHRSQVQADTNVSVTLAVSAAQVGKQVNLARTIVPVLFVPSDRVADPGYMTAISETMVTVQNWYTVQLGGATFNFAAPRLIQGQFPTLHYCPTKQKNGKCTQQAEGDWVSPESVDAVMSDLSRQGIRAEAGTILLIFWHGGGNSAQGTVTSPTSGHVLMGDWALEGISGKFEQGTSTSGCTTSQFASAFCKKNAQIGSVAHELAHAFDIPHPQDDDRVPTDPQFWFKSVMQAPWDWPTVVFLDNPANPEKARLRRSPFFWKSVVLPGLAANQ